MSNQTATLNRWLGGGAAAAALVGGAPRPAEACHEDPPNDLERGRILYLQVKLLQVAGAFERAVAVAIAGFALFGLEPPSEANAAAACATESREGMTASPAARLPASVGMAVASWARVVSFAGCWPEHATPRVATVQVRIMTRLRSAFDGLAVGADLLI